MKRIIVLILILFSVCVFGAKEDAFETEGPRLLCYLSDDKDINLFDNEQIIFISTNAFCNKRCETLTLPKYTVFFDEFSVVNNRNLKVLNLNYLVQKIEENAFAGNFFEEINVMSVELYGTEEKNLLYLNTCKAMGILRKDTVIDLSVVNPTVHPIGFLRSRKLYSLLTPKYKSDKGVLYSYFGDDLVAYPAGKKDEVFAVPFGVKNICDGSFKNCKNLKYVFIPQTVTSIGKNAFADNKNLILHVYKNSYAHKYCIKNKLKYEIENLNYL